MRRNKWLVGVLCATLASSMMLSSCIGSFSLSNKLLGWNKNVGDKFTNEVVFFLFWILPAYEVTILADLLVLNSIEFWSGNQPLSASTKVVEGHDGRYIVECDGRGYTVTSETDGSKVRFDFDTDEQTWSFTADGREPVKFMTFIDDTHVSVPSLDGAGWTTVELSRQGVADYALAR